MIEIIDMILTFLIWYAIGWLIFNLVVRPWLNRYLTDKIDELDREIAHIRQVYKQVKIEEHHGQFYLFDADTDQFLGQGYTAQDFADKLSKDIVIKIVQGEPEVIARFKSTIPTIETA